jgi:hypothetical protein
VTHAINDETAAIRVQETISNFGSLPEAHESRNDGFPRGSNQFYLCHQSLSLAG